MGQSLIVSTARLTFQHMQEEAIPGYVGSGFPSLQLLFPLQMDFGRRRRICDGISSSALDNSYAYRFIGGMACSLRGRARQAWGG